MNEENETQTTPSCIGALFKVIGVFALIVFGFFLLLYMCFSCDTSERYTRFNKKRITHIEEIFGITVMDNIELVEYCIEPAHWLDDSYESLLLKTSDYEKFLKHNVNYEIKDFNIKTYKDVEKAWSFGYDTEDYYISGIIRKNSDEDFYNIEIWYTW